MKTKTKQIDTAALSQINFRKFTIKEITDLGVNLLAKYTPFESNENSFWRIHEYAEFTLCRGIENGAKSIYLETTISDLTGGQNLKVYFVVPEINSDFIKAIANEIVKQF